MDSGIGSSPVATQGEYNPPAGKMNSKFAMTMSVHLAVFNQPNDLQFYTMTDFQNLVLFL